MQKEILYYVPHKKMAKFVDDTVMYKGGDELADNLSFTKGDIVDVELDGDKLLKITKVEGKKKAEPKEEKKEEKKEEVKKDEGKPEQDESVITTITVEAIRKDSTAIKIKEGGKWPKLDEKFHSVEALKKAGIVVNAVLDVKVQEGVIIDVVAIKETGKTEGKKEEKSSYQRRNSNRDEESVDKRTASMNATNIIVATINKVGVLKTDELNKMVKELTKTCYEAIQQL